jgi:nucleotide-binding universal stress UspA family protein
MAARASAPGFYRIVVPVDFSPASQEAWALGLRVAALSDAELVLLHVVPETPLYSEGPFSISSVEEVYAKQCRWAEAELGRWATHARNDGRRARVVVRRGVPHAEIISVATDERADLVVMATQGRGGLERALLGSVADRVIRLAPCPVLSSRGPA